MSTLRSRWTTDLSPGLRVVGVLFVLSFLATLVVVGRSFSALDQARADYDDASFFLTTAANAQREAARLLQAVGAPDRRVSDTEVELRRALFGRQFTLLGTRNELAETSPTYARLARQLERFDDENASRLVGRSSPALHAAATDLELGTKGMYDQLEIPFFEHLADAQAGRQRTQAVLLTLAIAVVVSGLAFVLSLRHRVRSAFDVAYRELEDTNVELVSASRVKDEFVAIVSHELRTPLTAISGFAATMEQHWDRLGEPQKQEMLAAISRQAARQIGLVDELLVMSRLVSGSVLPRQTSVEVQHATQAAIELVDLRAGTARVDVEPGLTAWCDPDHLQRILVNLLSNARKYGAAPFEVVARSGVGSVFVEVSDAGLGVPEQFVPHLFDRFTQADGSLMRTTGGIGLGLAIVHQLATLNGGEVTYRRGVGGGATFAIELPTVVSGAVVPQDDAVPATPSVPAVA